MILSVIIQVAFRSLNSILENIKSGGVKPGGKYPKHEFGQLAKEFDSVYSNMIQSGKEILEKLGYKVFLAAGGAEAIEIYGKNKSEIDLVILDMIMPDISGNIVFEKMKEINPEVKVLLSSGYSINGQAAEIIKKGCCCFIQKPFNIIKLSNIIDKILKKGAVDI